MGQVVGDWWEEAVALPLLSGVADELGLYLDTRFRKRKCRGDKVSWADVEGNVVDYDFVLELDGTDSTRGIPVAFVESFWRRGARHSKDKARDDSGKLTYMREAYPTARFLGILAAGEFTEPARELVRSRQIQLFWVAKEHVIRAFKKEGLTIDYPDDLDEDSKRRLASRLVDRIATNPKLKGKIAATLRKEVGRNTWTAATHSIKGLLMAAPTRVEFIEARHSSPIVFEDLAKAAAFLRNPAFAGKGIATQYIYKVEYSDASTFERRVAGLEQLRVLHAQLTRLANHMLKRK